MILCVTVLLVIRRACEKAGATGTLLGSKVFPNSCGDKEVAGKQKRIMKACFVEGVGKKVT